jgi:hypothetical protein
MKLKRSFRKREIYHEPWSKQTDTQRNGTMKLRPEYEPFLTGQEFSASLPMKMGGGPSRLCERVAYLEELVRGKRVIHVGCLDHVRLIERRVRNGTWLHMRLTKSARECLGIDIDTEAAAVAKRLGFDNVVLCDIIRDPPHPEVTASRWDYMILGEVVEHVDNPVLFLESIVRKYGDVVDRVILTVPNAFHLDNLLNALKHVEKINTDHRFWFTPFTLSKCAVSAGMEVIDYKLCLHKSNIPLRRLLYRLLLFLFPLLRGSLIMELSTKRSRS